MGCGKGGWAREGERRVESGCSGCGGEESDARGLGYVDMCGCAKINVY